MQMQGIHSEIYNSLKTKLIQLLAHVEAFIDFEADETNQVGQIMTPVKSKCLDLAQQIEGYISNGEVGQSVREG